MIWRGHKRSVPQYPQYASAERFYARLAQTAAIPLFIALLAHASRFAMGAVPSRPVPLELLERESVRLSVALAVRGSHLGVAERVLRVDAGSDPRVGCGLCLFELFF